MLKKSALPDAEGESAFTASSTSVEDIALSTHACPRIQSLRDMLRIELPDVTSGRTKSPASPYGPTGTNSPQTAIFRPDEGTFHRDMEERTPLSVEENLARQSAMALLHAGATRGASGRRGLDKFDTSAAPTFLACESAEVPRRKPTRNLFSSLMGRTRSPPSLSGHGQQQEMSSHGHERVSGGDQDGANSCSVAVTYSSGNFETHAMAIPLAATAAPASLPPVIVAVSSAPASMDRGGGRHVLSSSSPHSTPLPPSPPRETLSEKVSTDSSIGGGESVGMDLVLREASRIRGLRLTWLLYMLITVVITLFVLVLVQTVYESNRTLTQAATETVRAGASTLSNSVDMYQYGLEKLFGIMHDMNAASVEATSVTYTVMRDSICTSLYRAPIAFAMYNATGEGVWRLVCKQYTDVGMPVAFPLTAVPGVESVRVMDYGNVTLASRTFYNHSTENRLTYMVMMDKETVGRMLLNNDIAQYSTATLQTINEAYFVRSWNTTSLSMLFHTLTESANLYAATPTSPEAAALREAFAESCHPGSRYIWHTVTRPVNRSEGSHQTVGPADWPTSTTNPIPVPRLEHGRAWGQLSSALICGVQCISNTGDTCAADNPTNIWFLVDYPMLHLKSTQTVVTVVGAVSIVAVVLFSVIMFLVYLSITVPVNYLRYQLMRAVGSNAKATPWQRTITRWTYRLWLGDLTAIARSVYVLGLCFRLNKKYVPDHVLRNHAKELYLRRRRFNFLDERDLREETTMEVDSGTEDESEMPLDGANAVMQPSETHFLWRFTAAHEANEPVVPAGTATDSSTECAAAAAACAGVGTGATRPSSLARVPSVPVLAEFQPILGSRSGPLPAVAHEPAMFTSRVSPARRGAPLPFDGSTTAQTFYAEPEETLGGVPEASTFNGGGAAAGPSRLGGNDIMTIRREYESTILCIRIPSVELAYLINYSGAATQHRRLMRVLLHRIRRHKGALFHCSGDCLGAVWNAFEGCSNHAESAAVCAQEIANAFAPYRADGLHIGVVLHQGTLVCGTVEYSKTAFITAFGVGPREALAVAELAANVNTLNVLVTEPVKQALSGMYDCNIVDVIQLPNSAHPLLLFELGGSRLPDKPEDDTPLLSIAQRSQFAIEYARAFAQFRNHEFAEALQNIQQIRATPGARSEHLLRRLERLCLFYGTQPAALPRPYHRPYPSWVKYEAIAQAGLQNDSRLAALQNDSMLARSANRSVVYQGVPALRDGLESIRDFKEELQANMRRLVSPRLQKRKSDEVVSALLDDSCTHTHNSPKPSPSMRPLPLPTPPSAGMLSVASEDLSEPVASTASQPPHPADGIELVEMNLPPPLMTRPIPVPSLKLVVASTTTAMTASNSTKAGEGEHALSVQSSPHDMPSLSRRFSVTHGITNLPPVALASTPDVVEEPPVLRASMESCSDSAHSSAPVDTATCSIIQSAGMSFQETAGGMRSLCVRSEALPAEIKANNGTTYLRSTRILGKGSFGCVYLGMDAHSGRLVAIKFLPMPSDESGMGAIEAEVLILQRVNDTHVVQLLSYAFEGDTIVIVMECMLAGSLQNMISAFRTIPSSTARVFMRDVLRGLSKLHSMGVIHRDMKPQNVLLSLAGNCKLSDFGASAWLQELARKESRGEVCGTPVYLAPEAARGSPLKESDIWSCGIMFLQMITGRLPYSPEQLAAGAVALVFQIGSGIAQPNVPADLDELDGEFVRACLHTDPAKRAPAAALLQLALFTV